MKILLIFLSNYVNGYRPEEDLRTNPLQLSNEQFVKNIKSIKELLDKETNTCKKYFIINGDHHLKRDETGIIWYQKYLKSAF